MVWVRVRIRVGWYSARRRSVDNVNAEVVEHMAMLLSEAEQGCERAELQMSRR